MSNDKARISAVIKKQNQAKLKELAEATERSKSYWIDKALQALFLNQNLTKEKH